MSIRPVNLLIISLSIGFAILLSGCSGSGIPTSYVTLAPSPSPPVNTSTGDMPPAFDFNRAHWFAWAESLYMGAGSQSPSTITDFRIEYRDEIYNGSISRHCQLHVSTDNGNTLHDIDYYYDARNRRILYAKSVDTIKSGGLERKDTAEAPLGDRDMSGDAKKAVNNVRRYDPYLKNDSWAPCKLVGDEKVTIEKGTYNCKKYETKEGEYSVLTCWWNADAPMRVRSISADTKPGEEARFIVELSDWG